MMQGKLSAAWQFILLLYITLYKLAHKAIPSFQFLSSCFHQCVLNMNLKWGNQTPLYDIADWRQGKNEFELQTKEKQKEEEARSENKKYLQSMIFLETI